MKLIKVFLFMLLFASFIIATDVTITAQIIETNSHPSVPFIVSESDKNQAGIVELSWLSSVDDENDLITYFLKVGTSSGNNNIVSINTVDNSYSFSISTASTYYWSVKACDNNDGGWGNCSAWSLEDSFIVTIPSNPAGGNNGGGGGGSSSKIDINNLADIGIEKQCSICAYNESCSGEYVFANGVTCCFSLCVPKEKKEIKPEKFDEIILDLMVLDDLKIISDSTKATFDDDEIGLVNYALDDNEITIDLKIKVVQKLSNLKSVGYRVYFDYYISSQKEIEKPFILFDYDTRLIPNVSKITSSQDYIVIDASAVIGIIPNKVNKQPYLFSFYVDLDNVPADNLWSALTKPLVYVKKMGSCENVVCDDFDSCTNDVCVMGKCTHANICENSAEKTNDILKYVYYVGIGLIVLILVAIYLLKKHD